MTIEVAQGVIIGGGCLWALTTGWKMTDVDYTRVGGLILMALGGGATYWVFS